MQDGGVRGVVGQRLDLRLVRGDRALLEDERVVGQRQPAQRLPGHGRVVGRRPVPQPQRRLGERAAQVRGEPGAHLGDHAVVAVAVPAPRRDERADGRPGGQHAPQVGGDPVARLAQPAVGVPQQGHGRGGGQDLDRAPHLVHAAAHQVGRRDRRRAGVRAGTVRHHDDVGRAAAGRELGEQPAGGQRLVVGVRRDDDGAARARQRPRGQRGEALVPHVRGRARGAPVERHHGARSRAASVPPSDASSRSACC